MTNLIRFQIIFITFLVGATKVLAFTPSVESLFRNVSNAEIGEKTVIANLYFEKLNDSGTNLENQKKFATKFIFGNFDKSKKFIQINFNDDNFNGENIFKIISQDSVGIQNLGLSNENVEGKIVYSILYSLLNNNGHWIMSTLKRYGSDVKNNVELLNEEKVSLLKKYQRYLEKLAENKDLSEDLNPLSDDNPETQIKINETLKQSFYFKSSKVSKLKIKNKFYWNVEDNLFSARFDYNTRQLKYFKFTTNMGTIELNFKDYILQNASNEFPKEIIIKDFSENMYRVTLDKLIVVEDSMDRFRVRLQKYEEKVNNNSSILIQKPSFML